MVTMPALEHSEKWKIETPLPEADETARIAHERLKASAYRCLRNLQCESHAGTLTLHGRVNSFYLKQLAQESIRDLRGIKTILNLVEVLE